MQFEQVQFISVRNYLVIGSPRAGPPGLRAARRKEGLDGTI
jgi:hypothetical protein